MDLCGYLHGRELGIGSSSGGQFQSCDPKTPDVSLLIVTYRLMKGRRGGGGRKGGEEEEGGGEEGRRGGEERRREGKEGRGGNERRGG